jgi:hypothetical protein
MSQQTPHDPPPLPEQHHTQTELGALTISVDVLDCLVLSNDAAATGGDGGGSKLEGALDSLGFQCNSVFSQRNKSFPEQTVFTRCEDTLVAATGWAIQKSRAFLR